jgi:alkylated DNA nucleotide flippase Atl1
MAQKDDRPSFSELVLKAALSIPPGRVSTYGRIARAAGGGAMASQSVTGILGKAEQSGSQRIPWHRIVYADGHVWLDERTKKERLRLYEKEGIQVDKRGRIVNFRDILFEF